MSQCICNLYIYTCTYAIHTVVHMHTCIYENKAHMYINKTYAHTHIPENPYFVVLHTPEKEQNFSNMGVTKVGGVPAGVN